MERSSYAFLKRAEITLLAAMVAFNIGTPLLGLLGLFEASLSTRLSTILLTLGAISAYLVARHFRHEKERRYNEAKSKKDKEDLKKFFIATLEDNKADLTAMLDGVRVTPLSSTEEYYRYLCQRVEEATESVDDLTWGTLAAPERRRVTQTAFDNYTSTIAEVCQNRDRTKVREVFTFPTDTRLARAKKMASKRLANYYMRYYQFPAPDGSDLGKGKDPPLLQFTIIDKEEVIFGTHRGLYTGQEEENFLGVKHPRIVDKFMGYYNTIWRGGIPITEGTKAYPEILQDIEPII